VPVTVTATQTEKESMIEAKQRTHLIASHAHDMFWVCLRAYCALSTTRMAECAWFEIVS